MLLELPVQNCLHFLMPVSLREWSTYDVSGIVGVLRRTSSGQFEVIDAYHCDLLPNSNELRSNPWFSTWCEMAGGESDLRFDVFLMPQAPADRRNDVVTLLQRSTGFSPAHTFPTRPVRRVA